MGKHYLGDRIRKEIFEKTQMTASCGIAPNKMLAKICSDMKKPNGMTFLDNKE
jgi:nucleotidyltransferase/DNA polymerase involved in DNA repair